MLDIGGEALLVLRTRDNFSCILNAPALWQEKAYSFLLLPRDWEGVFLRCAEGELLILSTSHLRFFVL